MAKITFLCEQEDRFVVDFKDIYTNLQNFINYERCPICGGKILTLLPEKEKKLIYLSGPITGGGEFLNNIETAIRYGIEIIKSGNYVYIPHLDFFLYLKDKSVKELLFYNSWEIMKRCDELYVLPTFDGKSEGTMKEIKYFENANKNITFLKEMENASETNKKKD